MTGYRVLRQVQYRCLKCRTVVFQEDVDPSRVHERPECGGPLETMTFDPALWTIGQARLLGGSAMRCTCGNWFVSRNRERVCWSCQHGSVRA